MKIVVYGTLRKGQDNFSRFERNAKKFEVVEEGVELHDHKLVVNGLPFVTPCDGETVIVDILDVDSVTGVRIAAMEINAGYYAEPIQIGEHVCLYYPYPLNKQEKEQPNIEDYVKHNNRE